MKKMEQMWSSSPWNPCTCHQGQDNNLGSWLRYNHEGGDGFHVQVCQVYKWYACFLISLGGHPSTFIAPHSSTMCSSYFNHSQGHCSQKWHGLKAPPISSFCSILVDIDWHWQCDVAEWTKSKNLLQPKTRSSDEGEKTANFLVHRF